jgi:hypothetical protein
MLDEVAVMHNGLEYWLNKKQMDNGVANGFEEKKEDLIEKFSGEFLDINQYNIYMNEWSISPKIEDLCEYLREKGYTNLCLWGAGLNGTKFSKLFGKQNISITDLNSKTHGKVMPNGSVVKAWKDICKETDALLVCGSGYYDDVRNLVDDDILVVDFEKYIHSEDSPENFSK